MNDQLHIHIDSLEHGPCRFEGALPAAVLDLGNEPSIRNIGDLEYDLTAERRSDSVLVRGHVKASMDLECSRSGLFFSTIVEDSAFLRDYSISECPGHLDLTDEVREAVVINIPPFPVAPEAQSGDFVPPRLTLGEQSDDEEAGNDPWSALNNLPLS